MEQDHGKQLMCREGVRQSPINFEQAPELKLGGFISYIKKPRQPDQQYAYRSIEILKRKFHGMGR